METELSTINSIQCLARKFGRGAKLTNSHTWRVMTPSRLGNLIAQGFGQGRGSLYVPWIRVTRRKSSPKSNLFVAPLPIQERAVHLLSGIEHKAANLASWLGAVEIREQFAMFPWSHLHPMSGLLPDRDRRTAPMDGLLKIAAEAGIEHGVYVGTKDLPFVATCDLVIQLGHPPVDRLVFWDCKPDETVDNEEKVRANERIRLGAEYAARANAHHAVFSGTEVSEALHANLDWLAPHWKDWSDITASKHREEFAARFNATNEEDAIRRRIDAASSALSVPLDRAQELFRVCAWSGAIDIDLTRPIAMSRRVRRLPPQFKQKLKLQLMGADAR